MRIAIEKPNKLPQREVQVTIIHEGTQDQLLFERLKQIGDGVVVYICGVGTFTLCEKSPVIGGNNG
ncbi:hypothetical protein LCGC14_0316490 [marine sediment metagenome]|uniref:Uncharacterized protein n=1 Tax=marine sediment metagenome TaxID=412755 RepID=A0A0F9U349_9ZZZZ